VKEKAIGSENWPVKKYEAACISAGARSKAENQRSWRRNRRCSVNESNVSWRG